MVSFFPPVSEHFTGLPRLYRPELRRAYDRGGEEAVRRHQQGGSDGPASPFDMFSQFFGGGRRSGSGQRKGPNMVTEVEVELQDICQSSSFYTLHLAGSTKSNHTDRHRKDPRPSDPRETRLHQL